MVLLWSLPHLTCFQQAVLPFDCKPLKNISTNKRELFFASHQQLSLTFSADFLFSVFFFTVTRINNSSLKQNATCDRAKEEKQKP